MTEQEKSDFGLLIFRVSLGIVFLAHGYLKVFTFGIAHGIEVFAAHTVMHMNIIPGWFVIPAAFIEWVGGCMLIAGYKPRLVLPFLAAVAFGAGAVHFENGWNYTSKPDGGWEYGIFLFISCVVIFLTGVGKYTLPNLLTSRKEG